MAKAKKKALKKPAKKVVKKAVKNVTKKVVKKVAAKTPAKKVAAKKPVIKTAAKTVRKPARIKAVKMSVTKTEYKPFQIPNRKMFAMEITLLDKLQFELFEAIAQKPGTMDYEEMRLFVDNVYMTLNKTATIAKDVKNMILNKDFKEPITETYNSPA
ncbi:MAG: hypothetical protein PHN88_00410 [Ignavibacteria bacterium]|nr:hypothetical protein [Ignavibacteria bacterium]